MRKSHDRNNGTSEICVGAAGFPETEEYDINSREAIDEFLNRKKHFKYRINSSIKKVMSCKNKLKKYEKSLSNLEARFNDFLGLSNGEEDCLHIHSKGEEQREAEIPGEREVQTTPNQVQEDTTQVYMYPISVGPYFPETKEFPIYNGVSSPIIHLRSYLSYMNGWEMDREHYLKQYFSVILIGGALIWYMTNDRLKFSTWSIMVNAFIEHFSKTEVVIQNLDDFLSK